MASELYNTIDALSREKGIDPQIVVSAVEDAIVVATRKYYKTQENLRAELDKETGRYNSPVHSDTPWVILDFRAAATTRGCRLGGNRRSGVWIHSNHAV